MFEKLEALSDRYNEINERLMMPETVNNNAVYRELMKEYTQLTPIIETYKKYKSAQAAQEEALELMHTETDKDMKQMAEDEYLESKENISKYADELKIMLLPKDPNDSRNVIIEIRAGAGGEAGGHPAGGEPLGVRRHTGRSPAAGHRRPAGGEHRRPVRTGRGRPTGYGPAV